METLLQDLRYALRALARQPGFALVVILTLALGIGGNATVFTALKAALLAEPPYPDVDRLMALDITVTDEQGGVEHYPWSFPKYETMRAAATSFELIGIRRGTNVALVGGSEPVRVYAEGASADYFSLFGALPLVGRLFTTAEDLPGAEPRTVLLGHAIWRQQFGGDSAVIGRHVSVSGVPFEVAGVLRPGFRGANGHAEIWVPLRALPALGNSGVLTRRWAHGFQAFARRRDGIGSERAAAEMAAVGAVVASAHPDPDGGPARWSATAISIGAARTNAEGRTVLMVLGGAVLLVLLLACVNIANMQLARAAARERELVIRAALGAGRSRLVRQLVTESLLLTLIGGAAGLLVAQWGVELLRRVLPPMTGPNGVLFVSPEMLRVDIGVVVFTAAITLAAGFLMGLAPAWRFSRPEGSQALRDGAATARGLGSLRRPTLRGALVITEVALAVVLLVGAGLMLRTMAGLARVNPGFETRGLLTFGYGLPRSDIRASDPAFHQQVLERLGAIPGVQAAALSGCTALSGCYDINSVKQVDGRPPFASGEQMVRVHFVSEDYFRALGIPLLAGRTFATTDQAGGAPVVVLSAAAARRLYGDTAAVGRGISVSIELTEGDRMAEVVGVVGDVKHVRLREEPVADMYVSMRQSPYSEPSVYLRTAGDPMALVPAARVALRELAPDMPLHEVASERDLVAANTLGERLVGWSLAAFAALALALAAIGVYGVVAYSVGQRRREVAVRLALGAEPGRVLRLVLREGMTLVAAGAACGVIAALLLGRSIASLLYGVAPRDPGTLAAMTAMLLAVAAVAIWFPARRAAATDPMSALRVE